MATSCCSFRLTDSERERFRESIGSIQYDPSGGTAYVTDVRIAAQSALPRRVVDALAEQRASLSPQSHLIFDNLPVDEEVFTTPSPNRFDPSCKSGVVSENSVMAFAATLGEPYSIAFEGPEVVNNLIPAPGSRAEYTGLGSELELDFHIENAALKCMGERNFSPLGLVLAGVRHDPNGPSTRLSDARCALERLSSETVAELMRPSYRIRVPYRWRGAGEAGLERTGPVPIVSGNPDFPEVYAVFYGDMVESMGEPSRRALQLFHEQIKACSLAIDVVPGRLLYIDNRFTLHSRDAFQPTFDAFGNPLRWVQRAFIASNLWNHRNLVRIQRRVFMPIEAAA
ncbi:TauD/TfdA family dioxygenase [Lysobacter sp. TAF61]|uniref:TauD/TfdA family dioxygenase n=1 Tax=Lysobacter sp. TAF61 TaxID=3233072 RepID=UPI003F94E2B4